MKLIFLDVDHVMRPGIFGKFDKVAVDSVNDILKRTRAKIVVSSTWRYGGMHIIQGMFERAGIKPDNIIGITVRDPLKNRGMQIADYLENNKDVARYVILDDAEHLLQGQLPRFVKIDKAGLTQEKAEKAIRLLQD